MKNFKTQILLIEDNIADAKLVEIYLKGSGLKADFIHVDTFHKGVELLSHRKVDIVFLDLSLPDISGFKTLNKYLGLFPEIPVIVLTGIHNEIIGNQSIKAGAQDFLVKGQFDDKMLGRVVRYSLQRFDYQRKLEKIAHQLSISEKRYFEAQRMARFGTWQLDIVSNHMEWTREVFRILGFFEDSISPTLTDYLTKVHVEDRENVEEFFENAAKDGKLHKIEHRITINNTSVKYVTLHAKIKYEETTKKLLLIGGIQDITDRKLSEQLIVEKNISQKTKKLKEQTLKGLDFQIRTPLSSIINLLYLLEKTKISNDQLELISGLKSSVDDLSMSVYNMLNFSVLTSDNIGLREEEFNFNELFKSLKNFIKIKSVNAKLIPVVKKDKNIPGKIVADAGKLTQILYNVIDNAITFSPKGETVKIEAVAKNIQASSLQLQISITDNGMGMSSEKIKQLMSSEEKLLQKSDTDDEKNGLGVPIVLKLLKIMRGNLKVKSKPGNGTTFIITLPVKYAKQNNVLSFDKPTIPLRILLVEDHFLNQLATKKVLTTWSKFITVVIAANGQEGVDKFKTGNFDVILMDIQMPVMDGIDAAKMIREESDIPIIALTANSSTTEADRCFKIGMNDYLAKPFKPEDLYKKILGVMALVVQ